MSAPWLDALNDEQRAAATHAGGPLLILAGAGTGKTTALASRVAWLVASGTPAERILLLTFTRRAARQMLSRSETLLALSARAVNPGTPLTGVIAETAPWCAELQPAIAAICRDYVVRKKTLGL